MTFSFKSTTGRTHIGLAGVKNEDRFIIKNLGGGGAILAVADGLGGTYPAAMPLTASSITWRRLIRWRQATS